VDSGLNFLFLSIDGASQDSYGRFRRGGDFELCLRNIRELVEVKRERSSATPFLLWRFLTFEHNVHEVEAARQLAAELGVDVFTVATPFAVAWDDPEIRVARSPLEGSYLLNESAGVRGRLDDWRSAELAEPEIDREFERSWLERLPAGWSVEASRRDAPTCGWLYQNLTLDAGARLFPCCMAPEGIHHKVYGSLAAEGAGAVNGVDFRRSRLAFADQRAFEAELARDCGRAPYCAICREKPEPAYTLGRDVRRDLRLADPLGRIDDELVELLTTWPESR
jgi:hypothetical protein